jgi:hypothetical protein
MTDETTATPPLPGLLSRAIGVVVSPKATFEKVVATPKVLGALGLVTLMSVLMATAFMSSQRGRDAFFDTMFDRAQRSGGSAQQQEQAQQGIERFQQMATDHPAVLVLFTAGGNLFVLPIVMTIIGGILFVVFNVAMGGTATFRQMMAVVAHSAVMMTLQQLVATPLNLARGTMTSATNFSVLLPMFDETSLVGRFLGMMDLFAIWSTIVLAIGLGVLYRRSGRNIAMTFLILYGVVALGLALLRGR